MDTSYLSPLTILPISPPAPSELTIRLPRSEPQSEKGYPSRSAAAKRSTIAAARASRQSERGGRLRAHAVPVPTARSGAGR